MESTQLILILAIAFGLSMDYLVFLLSRIREQWDLTGDNRLNWWLPAPLERLWRRVGIRGYDGLPTDLPSREVEQPVGAIG